MNKKTILTMLLLPLLLSCSGEASGTKGSPVYTVTFLNDSGEKIGYAYVIEGKKAIFKDNDPSSPYDYLPTLLKRDEGINASHYVFDKWVGEYDASFNEEESAIDSNNIKHDCTLKAAFARKSYGFNVSFRSEMKSLYAVSLEDNSISCDEGISLDEYYEPLEDGTLLLKYPFKANPHMDSTHYFYYEEASFEGWNVLAGDAKNGNLFRFDEKKSFSLSLEADAWGHDDVPVISPNEKEGVLLLNTSLNSKGQPDYPAYFSNGESWVSLGLLSRTPTLTFDASYSKTRRSFEVYEFASKEDAENGLNKKLLGKLPYGTRLEIDATSSSSILRYGKDENNDGVFDKTPETMNLSYISPIQEWSGFCYGFSNFNGKVSFTPQDDCYPLDFSHISCHTALYPLQNLGEK